jgi:quercetin dioxygenase-like cupin family protein
MPNGLRVPAVVLLVAICVAAQTPAPEKDGGPVVLQKNEGEARTRRPRIGVSSPSTEFILKIGPKTSGSKHLFVFTEDVAPGATIPRHRHHGEEEVVLIETGSAHVWLGDKEYDAQAGATVFIPADTWVSMKNTGSEKMSVFSVWNEPGFEAMLRCGSVPKGETGPALSRDDVKACYHEGDAELDALQAPPEKKP